MIEPNTGQDRSGAERIGYATHSLTAQPKPKRHNAKLCPLVIRERIVNALAAGDSKRAIARTLRVSNNTVTAVAEQDWQKVEARKARIAAQAERAATRAFDRINEKVHSADDIPLNVLVPVAGVAVDKLIALRGDPGLTARIEHVHEVSFVERFRRFHDELKATLAANNPKPAKAEEATGRQLALPDGDAGSGCGG